jgi:predicted metalloendopeptidase
MNYRNDFYTFVNSEWLNKNDIPNDNSRWGAFQELEEDINNKLKNILEFDNIDYRLKIIYNQYNNNKFNYQHKIIIDKIIRMINNSSDYDILFDYMFKLSLFLNISLPINVSISSNMKKSDILIPHIITNGLGLPDRDYYFISRKKDIRNKYLQFIDTYLTLYNINVDSKYIYYIEVLLAEKTYDCIEKSDPHLLHNIMNYNEFIKKYPNLKFINTIFRFTIPDIINITNIKFITLLNDIIPKIKLEYWKNYFIFRVLLHFNDCINLDMENCYFDFYKKTLLGTKKQKPLWKKSIKIVDNLLGELLGKEYIKKHFNDDIKKTIHEMIKLIKNELLLSIRNNDWMEDKTKTKAIIKLNKMNIKIGYPDKYTKDYGELILSDKDSYLENIIKINYYDYLYDISRIYKNKNKYEWHMNPYHINAYYSSTYNEIVFPAGILQKPFFSLDQDMSENFGGIGMVIGHEIIHGFDDDGSKFDENGNLNNWWTKQDLNKYKKKLELVKEQYNEYEIEGIKLNGELTLGENVSDLGGINISIKSMMKYFKDYHDINKKLKLFFINYANIWRMKIRKQDNIQRLLTDPHSPPIIRVNNVVKNNDHFHKVFNILPTDKLYLEPNKRINIW